jgi:hypothetical protein
MRAHRLLDRPIISPELDPSIGLNIQGPSAIRVPDWVAGRLGTYYLYFADHKGGYIRLAYADRVTGPWRVHVPGSLRLEQSCFLTEPPPVSPQELAEHERRLERSGTRISHDLLSEITTPHIASPDVHVDEAAGRIVMYFHGLDGVGIQVTRVATSTNGIDFVARAEVLGRSYMRVFRHGGAAYALAMPGQVYRSCDGMRDFVPGPLLFNPHMRHAAVLKRGDELSVFWTQVGEAPERILLSRVNLAGDWLGWKEGPAREILRPERSWEGADEPLLPSIRSTAYGHVNQLRDPAILEDDGRVYLFYAVAGESGIAVTELLPDA